MRITRFPWLLSGLTLILTFCVSCSKFPKDMPQVAPCSVTVTNGSQPLADATVRMIYIPPADSQFKTVPWTVYGKTDESGKASMTTRLREFVSPGTPPGFQYKVTIEKVPVLPEGLSQEQLDKLDEAATNKYLDKREKQKAALPREVPETFAQPQTTPVTLEVAAESKNELTVDLAKYKK